MTEELQYYLGIDWGSVLCGVAIADSETRIANAYCEVEIKDFFDKIKELKIKINFNRIVVGKTNIKEAQFNTNDLAVDAFVRELRGKGFTVEIEEEFFSTKVAQSNLAEVRNRGISKNDNAESARIILQGWLDRRSQFC